MSPSSAMTIYAIRYLGNVLSQEENPQSKIPLLNNTSTVISSIGLGSSSVQTKKTDANIRVGKDGLTEPTL